MGKLAGQRSKRRRQQINYKFNDYDELLDDAIEEGTEWVWEDEEGNPMERPRDMGNYRRDQDEAVQSGKGQGKDIDDFLEEYERKKEKEKEEKDESDDEEEEEEEEEEAVAA